MFILNHNYNKKSTISQSKKAASQGFLLIEIGIGITFLIFFMSLYALWYSYLVVWQSKAVTKMSDDLALLSFIERLEHDSELAAKNSSSLNEKKKIEWQSVEVNIAQIEQTFGITHYKKNPYKVALVALSQESVQSQHWIVGMPNA